MCFTMCFTYVFSIKKNKEGIGVEVVENGQVLRKKQKKDVVEEAKLTRVEDEKEGTGEREGKKGYR